MTLERFTEIQQRVNAYFNAAGPFAQYEAERTIDAHAPDDLIELVEEVERLKAALSCPFQLGNKHYCSDCGTYVGAKS